MNNRHEIWIELCDLASPLAEMPCTMPYNVPEGYFEALTSDILSGVKAGAINDPECLFGQEIPFETPQGYFEQLPAQMMMAINEQDITAALPKEAPYTVPVTYFDRLPQQITAAAKKNNKTKLISVRTFWRQLRWTAAALLICGIGLGSYKMLAPHTVTPITNPEQALAGMPPAVIHEYIQQDIDDYDIDVIMTTMNTGNNVQTMTKQLDAQEIQQYLDATGWEQPEMN